MQIVAIGVNHKTAPVEVRERLALVPEELPAALVALGRLAPEAAILSTCNRTELYAAGQDADATTGALVTFLERHHRLPSQEIEPFLYRYVQLDAVRHLFGVASGIDSMILGETEILGQVRSAMVAASEAGQVGKILSRLFHRALNTGRKARVRTGISRHAVSVSYAAVQMARHVFGGLERCRVLVISAGEAGKSTAKVLRDQGAQEIGVANRTRERATALARELRGRIVDFDGIGAALVDFDIVISATASARFVLSADVVRQAMEQRDGRPLCLIDIAVPRDIDPESQHIPDVYLYDIDDLEAIALINRDQRRREVGKVMEIIGEEAQRFMGWLGGLEAVPAIKSLRSKADGIRRQELETSLRKLQHLPPQDRQRIDILTKAITRKLLHDPIVALKSQDKSKGSIDSIRALFDLDGE
ncbi:MAG: glutamyl-tRNA reductase [Dehalococcoidia bacterium]